MMGGRSSIGRLSGMGKMAMLVLVMMIVGSFFGFYFYSYKNPQMVEYAIDISDNWQYTINPQELPKTMEYLRHLDTVGINQPLYLTRVIEEDVDGAALMVHTNHQQIRMFVDGEQFFQSHQTNECKNPGMGLHFVSLPDNYIGKTLQIELVSPYQNYAGAPDSVYLGDIPSLTAFAMAKSIMELLLMVLCIAAGIFMIGLFVIRGLRGQYIWGDFFFGMFSILWGFYYPSTTFFVHFVFSPQWVSWISIGLYFLYPLPLMLYFFFQFQWLRKWFLPAVLLHGVFAVIAYALQILQIYDFPEMLNVYNPLYVFTSLYMIVLACIEIQRGNRFMRFTIPWVIVAFAISMHSLIAFYTTRIKQEDNFYHEAFFMLIMVVWFYNLIEFFRQRAVEQNDLRIMQLKNELTVESYQHMKNYVEQVAVVRHEMRNHLAALQILLDRREYQQINSYLEGVASQHEHMPSVSYGNHDFINGVLNSRLSRVHELGIQLHHTIAVPDKLVLAETDLCSVLMNILDNAIEACVAIPRGTKKQIHLTIRFQKPYLYISCINSKANSILIDGRKYLSTKHDSENHGYGIQIIQQIVEKYQGMFDINYTEDTFTISVALRETAED